jgi:hypothetical protein
LCGSSGKLEVRSVHHIQCRSCGFLGDLIQLHADVKQEGVDATIATLSVKGLLDLEGAEQTYIVNAHVQKVLRKLIEEKAAVLKDGIPSTYQGMMCTLKCRLLSQVNPMLRRHMIPLKKEDLYDLEVPMPQDADPVFKWWGRHGAIGIPTYDGVDVVGFWILTQRGSMYLPIINRRTAAAFACVPSMNDPAVFVVDTIEDAIRLTVWSALHQEKPIGFVVPVGVQHAPELYSAKRVVYWSSTDDPAWILRSRHCPQNTLMLNSTVSRVGVYPFDGDFPKFMHEVETLALPAYEGIAKFLLSLPRREAAKAISVEPMEPSERSKISAYASGEDVRILQQLFSLQAPISVTYSGLSVSETPNGWVCKNRVISSAMFYLDEVRPFTPAPDAMVIGSVVYDGRAVAFQERLSVLRRNAASWLENFVVQKFGAIVHIERTWKNRLLELSLNFRKPNAVMPGQRYGWSGKTLRMPFFIVDDKDITPSFEVVDGPLTPIPALFTEAEKDAFNSDGFCRIFLVMLRNLLRTSSGPGTGWALVNQPHVVERTAHALGLSVQRDPSDALIQSQQSDPIMRPTLLVEALGRVLSNGHPANLLISLDRTTAAMAHIFHGWPILAVEQTVEYQCLRGIFFVLQSLLSQPRNVKNYRELSTIVENCFGIKGALCSAGLSLDRAQILSERATAVKLSEFFVEMFRAGQLDVTPVEDGFSIRHADFYALVAASPVKVPEAKVISHELALAKFLSRNTDSTWVLMQETWNFHIGMATSR